MQHIIHDMMKLPEACQRLGAHLGVAVLLVLHCSVAVVLVHGLSSRLFCLSWYTKSPKNL